MSLLDKASLLATPNAVKASKLYSFIPASGTGDLTVTRNTTATRVNSLGLIENVAANVPRLNYDSIGGQPYLLSEPQRTNLLLNSATLATQSITTTAAAHTLSFRGAGTVTLSGSFSGSLVGTGVNNRVTLTFTPTAATLTLTISGSCTNGQIEVGSFATSYIPTTTAAVTRNSDLVTKSGISSLIGQTSGVLFIDAAVLFNDSTFKSVAISDGTSNNRLFLAYTNVLNQLNVSGTSQGVVFSTSITVALTNATVFSKIALKYNSTKISIFINGVKIVNEINGQSLPINLSRFGFDSGSGSSQFFGKIRGLHIYGTNLTDAECITLTT